MPSDAREGDMSDPNPTLGDVFHTNLVSARKASRKTSRKRNNKIGSAVASQTIRRHSTISDERYPMYVLSVPTILRLAELQPHQDMLKMGLLQQVTKEHIGKVIFVSHEWCGLESPDPRGDHLRCLQNALARLAAGEENEVQSHWMTQMLLGKNKRVRAKVWAEHLLHMYICK